jgi:hypothetical protein
MTRTIRTWPRTVAYLAVVALAALFVFRAEQAADTAAGAAEKAEATTAGLREEVEARVEADCRLWNDGATTIRESIVRTIRVIGAAVTDDAERIESLALRVYDDLTESLPLRDCDGIDPPREE